MSVLESLGFDGVNEMIIQELITGMIGHIEDKEMIKEKVDEGIAALAKIPDSTVVIITKLNGRVNACITEQTNIEGFVKEPEFIDIQAIVENIKESL